MRAEQHDKMASSGHRSAPCTASRAPFFQWVAMPSACGPQKIVLTVMPVLGIVGSPDVPAREWIRALHADQPVEARKSRWFAAVQLLFHGGVAVAGIATG